MAEGDAGDSGDKTEAATPRRREEARNSGQSAKSQDLTQAAILLVGLITLSMMARTFVESLSSIMLQLLGTTYWGEPSQLLDTSIRMTLPLMVRMLAPVMLAVALCAALVTGMQVGFRVNFKPLMPNLAKLSPIQGLGRLFKGQNWFQLGMNTLKLIILGAIAWKEVNAHLAQILDLGGMKFPENFQVASSIIYSLAWQMAMALFVVAAADWIYHRWKFERDIRMSKQEIKDETKSMEGDQATKGKRLQMARKMIIQRMHRDVPKADVVVTNPTELAIALQYDPEGMAAPRVVAKGAGFLAARIRQIAIQNGVPIMERKPLAQALYKTVEVGQEVPPEFYQAIAEILAYVYELSGKGMRRLRKAS